MSAYRDSRQPDLFTVPGNGLGDTSLTQRAMLPPDFIERVRTELTSMLATAHAATELPWTDWTQATLAELRFHSVARWLPEDEAAALRARFQTEMTRLFGIAADQYDAEQLEATSRAEPR
jgi:hypothetical protein